MSERGGRPPKGGSSSKRPAASGEPREPSARGAAAKAGSARAHGGSPKKGTPAEPMRVQRAVARAGLASRREADRLVAEGRIRVNGQVAVIGQVIDPATDVITLDGAPVARVTTTNRWIVLNKPAGVMTTRKDPEGRQTVFDLVEDVPGLTYVGRLDFMTEGVLLLTTDGTAAHALTHPSGEVERTYVATVRGDATSAVKAARRGVELDDGVVMPSEVSAMPLGNRRWAFEVTIAEGRTHEIRRLCDALGLEVERLVRTKFGPVRLGDLPVGMSRALSPRERSLLEAFVPAR
ncbi:MAG: rRNA pseudouridine synthase [Phycisphaerae bacterium]|nr:rRNA pseudouridine synthase [Gemmatimonadaceae bacterium]